MTILVLNHRPLAMRPIGRWLREAGSHEPLVMVTTRAAIAASPDIERAHFADIVPVDTYTSTAVYNAALALARRWKPDRVASSNEFDQIRAALLRERFGWPGQRSNAALAYRDKLVMRRTASGAGIPCPLFEELTDLPQARRFADRAGYPVVVKPRRGAGTEGITLVASADRLPPAVEAAVARPDGAVIEEAVRAPMWHIDGLAVEGHIVHCWPSRYASGALDAVQHLLPRSGLMLDAADPWRVPLQEFAADLIKAFGGGGSFGFHVEGWMRGSVPVLCEVTARASGGPVVAAYQAAFGVNLFHENFLAQCALPLNLADQAAAPSRYVGWVNFLTEPGTFTPPPDAGRPPTILYEQLLCAGSATGAARLISDTAVHALVDGATQAQAASAQQRLVDWWVASRPWR